MDVDHLSYCGGLCEYSNKPAYSMKSSNVLTDLISTSEVSSGSLSILTMLFFNIFNSHFDHWVTTGPDGMMVTVPGA